MQMDLTLPRNLWEYIGKPTLQKSSLLLCQFDGSVIKTLEYFKGSLELKDKLEVIPTIVTICKMNHKLIGNEVLNISSTKLINKIKIEKTGKLKNYNTSLKLKENFTHSYYEAWKLPAHWVETDVLSLDRMAAETRHDPVLSRITSRIRKNIWGNCSGAERPYKEIRQVNNRTCSYL